MALSWKTRRRHSRFVAGSAAACVFVVTVVAVVSQSYPGAAFCGVFSRCGEGVQDRTEEDLLNVLCPRHRHQKLTWEPAAPRRSGRNDGTRPGEGRMSEPSRAKSPHIFLLEEADFCRRRPGLQVVAYVHSAISRVHKRQETRSTWANATASGLGVHVAAVFMVGRAKDDRERQIVREESQRYHDIVQGDYDDDYRLLTYKGLSALTWIAEHCAQVPWTLHADDDIFIDIFSYMEQLEALNETSKERFICNHKEEPVLRTGRWKVEQWEFPDAEYPTYCSGGGWFLQTKLVPRLLDACRVVPFLWVDDVYITGLLAREASIKHYNGGGYCFEALKPVDIGKMRVWFYPQLDRTTFWKILIYFHRKIPVSYFFA
ncbi:beta-1,3-galactosyltransferase 5-like isoform X2 [Penaeus japonicus]|uniref:beta-1,3-galactosyltransferase 5-like isoform X2 n=1 Tax=Penaeus japonicus TaxID=27405 RepID=UPI001C71310D|nr:beta-1,3-galactosyltransferase 5-like isoform X2 [Penaeus japonicus]